MSKIRQLITYFIPNNYQLHLNISKSERRFDGTVVMTGQPLAKEIRLHAKGLDIHNVLADGEEVAWQLDNDEIVIKRQAEQITVQYTGFIDDDAMNGLYLCKYKMGNLDKELFATQFESHYARECFPCIDEPAAKATFDISIHSDDPDDKIILSNMPGKQSSDGTWHFATTPPMSTYLVAFVGGNLISKSTTTNRGIAVNAYATPAQSATSLDYALEVASRTVEFYEDYFGVDYPLTKLDNVALPDFSAGAMENWGLITYRETALLADADSSEECREYIATVIAHEVSHQWFGNLVTMQWWNDLWLNESFATLMENTAVDRLYPNYRIFDDFELSDITAAMTRDALANVQPVQQEVNSPDEIATLFDGAIVYAKGAHLLKMLSAYLGENIFRRGLKSYFQRYQYKNTVADDLWHELSVVSGQDIKSLMNPWITKPGYPIVKVALNDDGLTISQKKFTTLSNNNGASAVESDWKVPLFASNQLPCNLLDQPNVTFRLTKGGEPLQLNINSNSHFITQYDQTSFAELAKNFPRLAPIDKIKLLREARLLSLANRQDITNLYQLLLQISAETNQAVLAAASQQIHLLDCLVRPKSTEKELFKKLVKQLYKPIFNQLFIQPGQDDINAAKAKSVVLSRSIYGDNQDALDYCRRLFSQHHQAPINLPADIRAVVLSAIVKHTNDEVFDQLWRDYLVSQNADYKHDLCIGLTATTNISKAGQLLTLVADTNNVRPQDHYYFVAYLLANPLTRATAWQWMQSNWSWIKRTFGGDMNYDAYVQAAGTYLSTEAQLAEYNHFFETVAAESPELERNIRIGNDNIRQRLNWIKINQPILRTLLLGK